MLVGVERVANGKCKTLREGKALVFFFASSRHVNFLDCETETESLECEREMFETLKKSSCRFS